MKESKQEGYGLGVSKEGDGFAAPKSMTAWAVEVNGKIDPNYVVRSRSFAREIRNEVSNPFYDWYTGEPSKPVKAHVRKLELRVVSGR